MVAEIALIVVGERELMRRLGRTAKTIPDEIKRGMQEAVLLVASTSKKNYLSGPRPQKLGVLTNRLRSSITTKIRGFGSNIQGIVGTNVKYARIHELGGEIVPKKAKYLKFQIDGRWISARRVVMPARPFLAPALKDKRAEIEAILGKRVFALVQKG